MGKNLKYLARFHALLNLFDDSGDLFLVAGAQAGQRWNASRELSPAAGERDRGRNQQDQVRPFHWPGLSSAGVSVMIRRRPRVKPSSLTVTCRFFPGLDR